MPTVIVDVDGTVALHEGRSPYDWHRVGEDLPNAPVIAVVKALAEAGHQIVFMSGRDSVAREETLKWLNQHVGISEFELYMREADSRRKDAIVKRELFERHLVGREILCVLDDRDQVVRMWREELGLTCLQVAYGDF